MIPLNSDQNNRPETSFHEEGGKVVHTQSDDVLNAKDIAEMLTHYFQLQKENVQLRNELLLSKPLYSRRKLESQLKEAKGALETVSMYARINHDRPKDYGEIVDPVIEKLGMQR